MHESNYLLFSLDPLGIIYSRMSEHSIRDKVISPGAQCERAVGSLGKETCF